MIIKIGDKIKIKLDNGYHVNAVVTGWLDEENIMVKYKYNNNEKEYQTIIKPKQIIRL